MHSITYLTIWHIKTHWWPCKNVLFIFHPIFITNLWRQWQPCMGEYRLLLFLSFGQAEQKCDNLKVNKCVNIELWSLEYLKNCQLSVVCNRCDYEPVLKQCTYTCWTLFTLVFGDEAGVIPSTSRRNDMWRRTTFGLRAICLMFQVIK